MLSDEEKEAIKFFYKDYNAFDRLLADQIRYSNQWEAAELSLAEVEKKLRFLRDAKWVRWVRIYANTNPVMDKHEIPKKEYVVVVKEMPLVERGWMSVRDAANRQVFESINLKLALETGFRLAEGGDIPIEITGIPPVSDEFGALMLKHNSDLAKRGIVVPDYTPNYTLERKLLKER
jgi:hypothetical protein